MENVEETINSKELDIIVNRYGSFCGILLNKNISCVTFFSNLLADEDLKDSFIELSDCSWFDIVKHMTLRYPILHKSKKIKRLL